MRTPAAEPSVVYGAPTPIARDPYRETREQLDDRNVAIAREIEELRHILDGMFTAAARRQADDR